jgi:hypothetical protein
MSMTSYSAAEPARMIRAGETIAAARLQEMAAT